MARTYVALLHEYLEEMEELTDEEFGRLCRGLLRYSANGEAFEPQGNERFYVRHAFAQEDRHQESYEVLCQKRKEAARIRWDRERQVHAHGCKTDTNTETKTKTNTKTKTDSSPLVGGEYGSCLMRDAEELRRIQEGGW